MVIAWHGNAASVLDRPGTPRRPRPGRPVRPGRPAPPRAQHRNLAHNWQIGASVKRSLIAYDHWAARASGQRSSWAKGRSGPGGRAYLLGRGRLRSGRAYLPGRRRFGPGGRACLAGRRRCRLGRRRIVGRGRPVARQRRKPLRGGAERLAAADRYPEQVGRQRGGGTVNLVRHVTSQVEYRPRIGRAWVDAQFSACRLEPSLHRGHWHALRVTGCGPRQQWQCSAPHPGASIERTEGDCAGRRGLCWPKGTGLAGGTGLAREDWAGQRCWAGQRDHRERRAQSRARLRSPAVSQSSQGGGSSGPGG